ncbi:hypothetical protein SEMRO_81_G043600.1 [Seminavis robusta]|uniref:Uncharacterized protein n=1 Tax=Seminavis robusta TaxID=568900 RepID=A0A9N8H4C4_9STRA|nr:hypothetical protein SEMRO_81_G043600.1 [Seminavis robusta]|eukprot:Sro81_g043600.1 n/a (149) ;mRNA; r:118062-118508
MTEEKNKAIEALLKKAMAGFDNSEIVPKHTTRVSEEEETAFVRLEKGNKDKDKDKEEEPSKKKARTISPEPETDSKEETQKEAADRDGETLPPPEGGYGFDPPPPPHYYQPRYRPYRYNRPYYGYPRGAGYGYRYGRGYYTQPCSFKI